MNKKILTGVVWALFIGFAIAMVFAGIADSIAWGWPAALLMTLTMLMLVFFAASGAVALFKVIARINFWLLVAIGCGISVAFQFFNNGAPAALMVFAAIAVSCTLIGIGVQLLRRKRAGTKKMYRILAFLSLVIGIGTLAGGLTWFFYPGKPAEMPGYAAIDAENLPPVLEMDHPGEQGPWEVCSLSYGSGKDKRREAFGTGAALVTQPVDGSTFLESWKGFSGKMRRWYFGFDQKELPLNAQVWYPQGEGPFPLVLIVHGNHLARDFSDPGYEYLGKLLASRGYILASVDENFLNGSHTNIFKGLRGENNVRGWLLLKHLQVWKEWNLEEDNPFCGKVDMDRIALIGHSRGGEAVAHAALFNRLPYYPDNATEVFDFNFNICSVIAIAPSDGQYQPGRMRTPLTDVNYLVIQGSHDADMSSYQGMRQFNRVRFSEGFDGFVAGIYIWGANHGQFNSVWGRTDFRVPRINFYNLGQLMSPEDQMTISKTYISAFLEVTLRDKKDQAELSEQEGRKGQAKLKNQRNLENMFKDYRYARNWLPETVYLSQYREPGVTYIGTFAEDLDLTTGTLPGSEIHACDLSIWREQALHLNWGDSDTRALTLGWNTTECATTACDIAACDTAVCDTLAPAWHISWPDGALGSRAQLAGLNNADSAYPVLTFSLAAADEKADPPGKNKEEEDAREAKEEKEGDESKGKAEGQNQEVTEDTHLEGVVATTATATAADATAATATAVTDSADTNTAEADTDAEEPEDTETKLIDFTIRLTDRDGTILEFPLSDFSPVRPVLKRQLTKLAFMQKQAKSETILRYYYFPLERYATDNPDFDFAHIVSLSFIFNITPEGVVLLNNIGL